MEKNERELELYRTGKKSSNKNSFVNDTSNKNQSLINKKNELNEILNTVYMRKNKDISIVNKKYIYYLNMKDSILLTFIQSVDPKSFELLRTKQLNVNTSSSIQVSYESSLIDENNRYDQEKLNIIHQSISIYYIIIYI